MGEVIVYWLRGWCCGCVASPPSWVHGVAPWLVAVGWGLNLFKLNRVRTWICGVYVWSSLFSVAGHWLSFETWTISDFLFHWRKKNFNFEQPLESAQGLNYGERCCCSGEQGWRPMAYYMGTLAWMLILYGRRWQRRKLMMIVRGRDRSKRVVDV